MVCLEERFIANVDLTVPNDSAIERFPDVYGAIVFCQCCIEPSNKNFDKNIQGEAS